MKIIRGDNSIEIDDGLVAFASVMVFALCFVLGAGYIGFLESCSRRAAENRPTPVEAKP